MSLTKRKEKAQPGTPAESGSTTKPLERKAPESSSLLKNIDSNLKQKDSQDTKKKRILERCGCF